MPNCQVCGKSINEQIPHFTLTFHKESFEGGAKKILESTEAGKICPDCGAEGLPYILQHLKLARAADTALAQRMEKVKKAVDMVELVSSYGLTTEKLGYDGQYITTCPFHGQERSMLVDADKKEYFCVCEGFEGDVFSFVINYDRDVLHKHTTLKQAVDLLAKKYPAD